MSWDTSTVTIGHSTKKSDYDRLRLNDMEIASGSFTFHGTKTFKGQSIFSATATFKGQSIFSATAAFLNIQSWKYQDQFLLAEQSGVGTLYFYIKKPISGYIWYDANSSNSTFDIYQNGGWRNIETYTSGGGDTVSYNFQLNPGYYRFNVVGGTGILRLYGTGVFGSNTMVLIDIID